MQFSDTTNLAGLIQRCEDYTGIGTGNISGDSTTLKKFTNNINEALYEIITEIMRSIDSYDWDDVNHTGDYPIGTFALTTNRDYTFPSSLKFLTLKRLDVTYDGVNWYRASEIDSSVMGHGLGDSNNASREDAYYDLTKPRYDPKSDGFWLYPKATQAQVDAGAKARIEFTRNFDEFTSADGAQQPPIDRPFHDLIAILASIKWAIMKDQARAQNLNSLYLQGLDKLKQYYGRKNTDEQLTFDAQIPSYS